MLLHFFFNLISLVGKKRLEMCLIDEVISYLYESLDANINVKFSDELKITSINKNDTQKICRDHWMFKTIQMYMIPLILRLPHEMGKCKQ